MLKFPNGGGGFKGVVTSLSDLAPMRRPGFAESDPAYFRFSVIIALLLFLLAYAFLAGKPGRAWASIRQSEPSAFGKTGSVDRGARPTKIAHPSSFHSER